MSVRRSISSRIAIRIAACLAFAAVGCSSTPGDDVVAGTNGGSGGGFATAGTSASGGVGVSGAGAAAVGGGQAGVSGEAGSSASGSGGSDAPVCESSSADRVVKSACFKSSAQAQLLPANILFVIDRSGSMACNPPPTTDSVDCEQNPVRADMAKKSKWEITSQALIGALATLPPSASVGVSYFSNDDACGVNSQPTVPIALDSMAQQSTIGASLMGVTPSGGTPIVGATILAYKHMHDAALAGQIFGNQFVVLITDGQQSEQCDNPGICAGAKACTDYLVNDQVPKAAGKGSGIRTFVIGVPGSEPSRTTLSQIALSGGTAADGCKVADGNCHFDMTKEADLGKALSAALAKITGQTITCELPVPQPAKGKIDLSEVNVVYTPGADACQAQLVPQDADKPCAAGADGWQYTADNTKIRLCGKICDTVRADTGGRVDVVLGCPSVD